ncbi:MAG: ABC transporter ATP-binding protein [Verrucomicrobiota bacterium]
MNQLDPATAPPDAVQEFSRPEDSETALGAREQRRFCYRLIRSVAGQLGWKYRLWIPFAVILSAVHLLPPRFLQFFTEGSQRLTEVNAADFLKWLLLFGIAVAICQLVALVIESILSEWLRLRVGMGLKQDAVDSLNQTRIETLDTAERGDWMTRMTGDLYNAEEFMTQSLPEQITNATLLLGVAGLFFYHSGPVAVVPILAAGLLAWVNIVVQRKMAPTLGAARELEGGVFQSMIETFEGLRTIRSYGGERHTSRRINSQLQDLFRAGMSITKSMAGLVGTTQFMSQLVIVGVLTLVAYRIRGEALTASDALVYPFYLSLFLGAAQGLLSSAYDWNRFFIEGGRLASLLYDDTNKEEDSNRVFGELENGICKLQTMSAHGLTIAYGEKPPVIDDFDFQLSRGEIVALMGPSGCGKSTFLECFAGLRRPNRGDFRLSLSSREESFSAAPTFASAFVEQQPYLFVGSVRENLTIGMDSADESMIWEALGKVGLSEIIESRGGLEAVLMDRGRNLSVGQQYRLALCRALISGRPFLLMDEPFAALDDESIELVCAAIQTARDSGAGICLVTHLIPEHLHADRVVQLTEPGTEELPHPPMQ